MLPVEVDENPRQGESGEEYVLRLAENKARASAALIAGDAVVVAADTCVVGGDDLLGKPADASEAAVMLRRLRGKVHQVYSALAVMRLPDGALVTDLCVTDVPMREYSDQEMLDYIASGDPFDKAGAYAIQHSGFHPVEKMEGCFANVMGLPLCHLQRSLMLMGISPQVDLPAACQSELEYHCPVFNQVLGRAQ